MRTFTMVFLLAVLGSFNLQGQSFNEFPAIPQPPDSSIGWKRQFFEGFTQSPSVRQGDTVFFKVSTLAGCDSIGKRFFNVYNCAYKIFRVTSRVWTPVQNSQSQDSLVITGPNFTGTFRPTLSAQGDSIYPGDYRRHPYNYRRGCDWATSFYVTTNNWPSGAYYAKLYLTNQESDPNRVGYIPFVVRAFSPGSSSKILCVIAWNTYQAYNYWGGGSLYYDAGTFYSPDTANTTEGVDTVIHVVSFRRPFIDFWPGDPPYPMTTLMGQVDHRERFFCAWAYEHHYPIEYCVDADVHADSNGFLANYALAVFPGHSEYWSKQQFDNISKTFKGQPGNLAFLAANNAYWRVNYYSGPSSSNPDSMFCNKNRNEFWWRNQLDAGTPLHESSFIGVEFQGVNNVDDAPNKVVDATHWIIRGTGLGKDSVFGKGATADGKFYTTYNPLISGESDMVTQYSPANTDTLASLELRTMDPSDDHYNEVDDHKLRSQMTYYEDNSTNSRVFAAGSFGWSSSLFGTDSVRMGTMHRSILDHFSGKKYIGNVYTLESNPLKWTSNIELDGNVDVLAGKYLKISTGKVTVDSVVFAAMGTIEISSGSDTITGKNGKWGILVVRSGGTLKVKSGATLTLLAPLHFVVSSGGSVVLESGSTLVIKTSTSLGNNVNFTVPSGATLKVEPTGEMFFGGGSSLIAYGKLLEVPPFSRTGS